jgi:hypothetical protein
MAKIKKTKKISPKEAIELLSFFEEYDINDPYRIGIVEDKHLVSKDEDFPENKVSWITSANLADLSALTAHCFASILSYFKQLLDDDQTDWNSDKVQKGVASIFEIAGNAKLRLKSLFESHPDKDQLIETIQKEYEALEVFFTARLAEKIQRDGKRIDKWDKSWDSADDSLMLDLDGAGLSHFDAIMHDRAYELFYLKDSSGKPFFNKELLREVKLFRDFDPSFDLSSEPDPFLPLKEIEEKDMNGCAMQILQICHERLQELFHARIRKKESECIRMLHYAIYALMLCANTKNLTGRGQAKTSRGYFQDFLYFFEKATSSNDYMKWEAYPPSKTDTKEMIVLQTIHDLAFAFFTRKAAMRKEMDGFAQRLIRRGDEIRKLEDKKITKKEGASKLHQQMDALSFFLSYFPSGPVVKIVDLLMDPESELFFSPIRQGNLPFHLFSCDIEGRQYQLLRLPSPVMQKEINKASVIGEFFAFLRSLKERKKNLLLVQYEDKNSWREEARAKIVESVAREAEFNSFFTVITLPKSGMFYHQIDAYAEVSDADAFIQQFCDLMQTPKISGIHFSSFQEEIDAMIKPAAEKIHAKYFQNKKTLSREERKSFIDLTYCEIIRFLAKEAKADYIAFTSKDAIDAGLCDGTLFYIMCEKENNIPTEQSYGAARWALFSPALLYRERMPHPDMIYRITVAMDKIERSG